MKKSGDSLQRLFRAASLAPKDGPASLPAALESRMLAQWRAVETEDEFVILIRLFRRAVIFAGLIMVLSATWSYLENRSDAATMALASYAIKMQLPP